MISTAASKLATRLLVLATILSSVACQHVPVSVKSLPRTEHSVVLDVPPVIQDELYACGLASVTSLCSYYGVEIPQAQREHLAALARQDEGLTGAELRDTLRALGMQAFLVRGTLDHASTGLYGCVDRSRPALVLLSSGAKSSHYCLFAGYDESVDTVYVQDPALGGCRLARDAFVARWDGAQRFTLIAVPTSPAAVAAASVASRKDSP